MDTDENFSLVLEPINCNEPRLINTAAHDLDLIKGVEADIFNLLLDTFHMNIEEADPNASIRKFSEHIFHIHVADSNR